MAAGIFVLVSTLIILGFGALIIVNCNHAKKNSTK